MTTKRSIVPSTGPTTTFDARRAAFLAHFSAPKAETPKPDAPKVEAASDDFAGDPECHRHEGGRPGGKGNKPHRGRPETEIRV